MRTIVTLYIEHDESDDSIHEVEKFADSVAYDNRFAYPALGFRDYMIQMNVSDTEFPEEF